jgi:hypothetical protein
MSLFSKILEFFGFEKTLGAVITRWRIKRRIPSVPEPIVPIVQDKPIEYMINDPSTPSLVKSLIPPTYDNNPPIVVKGYKGGGFERKTVEGQAANCFVTVVNTIKMVNEISEIRLPKWAGTSTLNVIPRAGNDLNAYYDRRNLKFFYVSDKKFEFFTCDSSDIVAHELGHAIMDTYRPDTWSVMSLEVASFHEAFADFIAMMHILNYDESINHIVNQTNGDLRQKNVMSKLAEDFGELVFKMTGPEGGRYVDALRHAINDFKYVTPGSLPEEAPNSQLAAECHSFGRIFLGALYDVIVLVYEDKKMSGLSPFDSLKQARDIVLRYVLKALQNAPLNTRFYESMAKTILWADVVLGNRKYHDQIRQIFFNRNILSVELNCLSFPVCENEEKIVKIKGFLNIKLSEVLLKSQSTSNPLYDVEIEIPTEEVYLYDLDNNFYDKSYATYEECLNGAVEMVDHLHNTNSVSDNTDSLFSVIDGKLVRNYFS